MNTYGYVGGNTLSWVDSRGLAASDVDAIWNDILSRYPEIKPRGTYIYSEKEANLKEGGTDPSTGNISISSQYECNTLDINQFMDLYALLLHESMHSTDSPIQVWRDSPRLEYIFGESKNHGDIYRRVLYEMGTTSAEADVIDSRKGQYRVRSMWGKNHSSEIPLTDRWMNPYNIRKDIENLYKATRQQSTGCQCH